MELNHDCIRSILLVCEEKIIMNDKGEMNKLGMSDFSDLITDYGEACIKYSIKYMKEYGLINARIISADNIAVYSFFITDITPIGHDFIGNIKNESNWNKTKNIAAKTGTLALDSFIAIASGIVTTAIQKSLGF